VVPSKVVIESTVFPATVQSAASSAALSTSWVKVTSIVVRDFVSDVNVGVIVSLQAITNFI